jgi:transaldolase
MSHNLLHQIQAEGVSIWLDGITRAQLRSGELARLVGGLGVAGVTTNPTLFAASLDDVDAYAADLADVRARHLGSDEAARLLAAADVRTACDILLPLHEQTERVDGWVSLEVNPAFADDLDATLAEVRALTWLVDRPNLMVKVPATPAGIAAIAVATGEGYNINATLIFSPTSYREVLAAYTEGLKVARSAGLDISTIHSVASVFVSRVDVALNASSATAAHDQAHEHRFHRAHHDGRHAAQHQHRHRPHPKRHHTDEHTDEHTD